MLLHRFDICKMKQFCILIGVPENDLSDETWRLLFNTRRIYVFVYHEMCMIFRARCFVFPSFVEAHLYTGQVVVIAKFCKFWSLRNGMKYMVQHMLMSL